MNVDRPNAFFFLTLTLSLILSSRIFLSILLIIFSFRSLASDLLSISPHLSRLSPLSPLSFLVTPHMFIQTHLSSCLYHYIPKLWLPMINGSIAGQVGNLGAVLQGRKEGIRSVYKSHGRSTNEKS